MQLCPKLGYFTNKYLIFWVPLKALNMPSQMRHGSLLSSWKWQSINPKCRGPMVEASPTQKATKWHKVWWGLKGIKSDIFKENEVQKLNLGHFETTKWKTQKIGWSRPEKSKLEKGWFGSKQSNTTLRVDKKQGLLNLLPCHLAISWGWAVDHTSSDRGISGLSAD